MTLTATKLKHQAINILVVDDSKSMLSLIEYSINDKDYGCEVASNGEIALELARSNLFDVILTDINMPGMDGFTLTQELRKLKQYEHTPILALTTEWADDAKQKGREVGLTGWIVKPFDQDKLINAIEKVTL